MSELLYRLIHKQKNIFNFFFVIYNFLHLTFRNINLNSTYFAMFISVKNREKESILSVFRYNIKCSLETALESEPCLHQNIHFSVSRYL
jgi:hypothetical protein